MQIRLRDVIAPHFWSVFNHFKMHNIIYGGRGSTKTSMIALYITYKCISDDNCSVVILRRHQNQLRNSVYKEIKKACSRLGLQEGIDYRAYTSPMQIKFYNDNTIYFAGGDDYETIKGMTDEKKPIKIVWFEEVTGWEDIDQIDQIIATFTRGNHSYFNVFYSYNPPKNKYDVINEWALSKRGQDGYLFHESDYRTVPAEWLGKMFIDEAERLKKYDEKRYRWIYLGEVIGLDGLIFNYDQIKIKDKDYIKNNNLKCLYIDLALDVGYSTSATTCLAIGYMSDGEWYLLDNYYYSPVGKMQKKSPSQFAEDIYKFRIKVSKEYNAPVDMETIDSAETALVNEIYNKYGIKIHKVNKGTNKEEQIDFAQDFLDKGKFNVIDNNNNKIFLREMKEYKWKEDSIEKGKAEPDKTEKELKGMDTYFNTNSNSQAYSYCDHTCDAFIYYVLDNKQKLGIKF